jgi:beta-1,4-mannosyltransferase
VPRGIADDERDVAIDPQSSPHGSAANGMQTIRRVTIAVLGDLGRSPRMQYHALALAAREVQVDLVGYRGSLPQAIEAESRITCHFLAADSAPRPQRKVMRVVLGAVRAVRQAWALFRVLLFRVGKPDVVLVQSPPAVPTLAVALLAARLRSARLIIDWHNTTSSLVGLVLGVDHLATRWIDRYERMAGRLADAHLCVSHAMREQMAARWGITATVMPDRPAHRFTPASNGTRGAIVRRLWSELGLPPSSHMALVVAPLGWTIDDDVQMLIEAVSMCESLAAERDAAQTPCPDLLILLTGRGPERDAYLPQIRALVARRVHVRAEWLSPQAYAEVLGAADLGLSLHRSSSGVDLPMKIADMFGAHLPVCALDYGPVLNEMLHDGDNGVLFRNSAELATRIVDLCAATADAPPPRLERLRDGAARAAVVRWQDEWGGAAWPVIGAS